MHIQVSNLLSCGPTDYQKIWNLQKQLHQQVATQSIPNTLLLVEHKSIYTAGARSNAADYQAAQAEVLKVDRGGRITWHGPGQLVVYPILRLKEPLDVVAHIRLIEQAVIDLCAHYELKASTVNGQSGVWIENRKICAVGCRVAKNTTMHGIGLNCNPNLQAFNRIVACGLPNAKATSLTQELANKNFVSKTEITVNMAAQILIPRLKSYLQSELASP